MCAEISNGWRSTGGGRSAGSPAQDPLHGVKNAHNRLIESCSSRSDWAIGFVDEVWQSRFALPEQVSWVCAKYTHTIFLALEPITDKIFSQSFPPTTDTPQLRTV
ncbi:hypothetical protein EPA93_15825 [Ktedonosporobacter rubrisoli]|uniref:Uncharacterized protein n=1 Tax=Ktedonosporobacter rubrisoli TaxID=2509675 RepID=A0A4P6JQ64_KTERU|nr:hypothetical protein EPA93_15825 [Ktedonosporobacter rubrisoli]